MQILIDNRQTLLEINLEELRTKARRILQELAFSDDVVLSLAFVDTSEMTLLNQQYRGKGQPTNVLSFSQREGPSIEGPASRVLGDVVICTNICRHQAEELGYTDQEMMYYLLIHGIVHLAGHTHDGPNDSVVMQHRVDEIFDRLIPSPELVSSERQG